MEFKKVALHITLQSLKDNNACEHGYGRLVAHLGDDYPLDKPINLLSCLDSNPIEDVVWALRATLEDAETAARLIAADFAESVLHIYENAYANDRRPRDAIVAARAFALGEISEEALAAAEAAARDAARDAAWAAAEAAAWAAARDAARAAARAAAEAAARAAAEAAAWAAEKAKQAEILRKYLLADGE